jgi:hypothetical protein
MNIPQDTLQAVADAAFQSCDRIELVSWSESKYWKHQPNIRRAVIQHALSNPALAPFLAGVGEYTAEELARAGNAAWESKNYFGLQWLRSFLAALPRRESPALAKATPPAEPEPAVWSDPVCGCIRSPDAPKDSPCPICKPAAQAPLGPEDVPPGSTLRAAQGHWFIVLHVEATGVTISNVNGSRFIKWHELNDEGWQINISRPDTGRWDKDAWRPCSKPGK